MNLVGTSGLPVSLIFKYNKPFILPLTQWYSSREPHTWYLMQGVHEQPVSLVSVLLFQFPIMVLSLL